MAVARDTLIYGRTRGYIRGGGRKAYAKAETQKHIEKSRSGRKTSGLAPLTISQIILKVYQKCNATQKTAECSAISFEHAIHCNTIKQ